MLDYSDEFVDLCREDGQNIERLIRAFYRQQTRRDMFIDGGAHHGYHSLFAAQHFEGPVVGVEASPATFTQLLDNRLEHAAAAGNLYPVFGALGHRSSQGDTVEFCFSPSHPGRSTVNPKMWELWGKGEVEYEAPVKVPMLEVDILHAIYGAAHSVDFIKLDLEGNEVKALRGAAQTLMSQRPNVVMEFGLKPGNQDTYGESLNGFRSLLQEWGYRAYAPWGEDITDKMVTGYKFWYAFLFPQGDSLTRDLALLKQVFEQSLEK